MRIKAFIMSGVVLFGSVAADAVQPLKMRVSASHMAPAEMFVYVSVERRIENRALVVTAESEDFFGSSTVTLDGDQHPRVMTFRFQHLPPGAYDIEAELIGNSGRGSDETRYRLLIQ
jgi:hypothetical protein